MSLCRFVSIGKISLLPAIIEQVHGYLLNSPNPVFQAKLHKGVVGLQYQVLVGINRDC
jgi:hypothetical protein